jgi:hypothetical protein
MKLGRPEREDDARRHRNGPRPRNGQTKRREHQRFQEKCGGTPVIMAGTK